VPESAVVIGVPQGIFVGRGVLSGKSVCLLFLGGGRITRAIPVGGLESVDWARHRAAHAGDSGTWAFERGNLVIRSKTGRKPEERAILGYQVAPDGVVFMTVLDIHYPRTKKNIEMYAEQWVERSSR
jgi:hypothetical protein